MSCSLGIIARMSLQGTTRSAGQLWSQGPGSETLGSATPTFAQGPWPVLVMSHGHLLHSCPQPREGVVPHAMRRLQSLVLSLGQPWVLHPGCSVLDTTPIGHHQFPASLAPRIHCSPPGRPSKAHPPPADQPQLILALGPWSHGSPESCQAQRAAEPQLSNKVTSSLAQSWDRKEMGR